MSSGFCAPRWPPPVFCKHRGQSIERLARPWQWALFIRSEKAAMGKKSTHYPNPAPAVTLRLSVFWGFFILRCFQRVKNYDFWKLPVINGNLSIWDLFANKTCPLGSLHPGAHYESNYLISQGGKEVNQGLYVTMTTNNMHFSSSFLHRHTHTFDLVNHRA